MEYIINKLTRVYYTLPKKTVIIHIDLCFLNLNTIKLEEIDQEKARQEILADAIQEK